MNIGIDLDGTAWAHIELFQCIFIGLKSRGHRVGILTGHNEDMMAADIKLWIARKFPPPDFYIAKNRDHSEAGIPAEVWKPLMMKRHEIDYLFDDLDTDEVKLIVRKVN